MQTIGLGAVPICWSFSRDADARGSRVARVGDRLGLGGLLLIGGWLREEVVEAAGEVALQGAQRAFAGFAFGFLASEVLLGRRVVLGAGDRDDV